MYLKIASAMAALLLSAQGLAHHSASMFDRDKEVTVTGTVVKFEFTNPHSWLTVAVTDDSGKVAEWALEGQGPSTLLRFGVKQTTFKPGDKITATANPMKDGTPVAVIVTVTSADGHVYRPLLER